MFTDSEQNPPRGRLRPHQSGGQDHDYEYRVAGNNVLFPDPHLNYRLAQNEQDGGNGKNRECTEAVAGNKNLAQKTYIPGRFRLASHGKEVLRQRNYHFPSVIDDACTDVEISN